MAGLKLLSRLLCRAMFVRLDPSGGPLLDGLNHVAGARWGLVLSLVVAQGLDDIGDGAGV